MLVVRSMPISVRTALSQMRRYIQGDHKTSVHAMITIQKVTSYVQCVPHQSPDIY
jgi:hypothetical protein